MHTVPNHVSPALVHLRSSVTLAALAAIICCVTQVLVFGFVHYTDARWEVVRPDAASVPLTVVPSAAGTKGAQLPSGRKSVTLPEERRVLSKWDATLRRASEFASVAGTIACVSLGVFSALGVVVAGGAGVPGVGRCVSAVTWATFLGLACVPWSGLLPALPFPGVLGGYEPMIVAKDAGEGGLRMWVLFLVLPITAITVASVILVHFRAGVEAGVIVASAGDLDRLVEKEIATISSRGPGSNFGPRSVGALGQAIGDAGRRAPLPEPPAAVAAAMGLRPHGGRGDEGRSIGRPTPGDPQRRLI